MNTLTDSKNKKKINVKGFFEEGFESKDWINATSLPLPATLKYMSHDIFAGRYGDTNRFIFQNKDGEEVRLLCKGNTFLKAVEKFLAVGQKVEIRKNEKGYWMFNLK